MQVFVADEQADRPIDAGRIGALAERVLEESGLPASSELNVLLVDERTMGSLNERFLQKRGSTDVLSFPIEDELPLASFARAGPVPRRRGPGRLVADGAGATIPLLLGDVVICPEVAWRNAPGHAGTYEDELALLLVHGILHLLGMDHEDDAEAAAMEALEQALLARHTEPAPEP